MLEDHKFIRIVLIWFFAASMVLLGTHDLHRRYLAQKRRAASKDFADSMYGTADVTKPKPSKRSEGRASLGWGLPSFGDSESEGKDREGLNDLVEKFIN